MRGWGLRLRRGGDEWGIGEERGRVVFVVYYLLFFLSFFFLVMFSSFDFWYICIFFFYLFKLSFFKIRFYNKFLSVIVSECVCVYTLLLLCLMR